MLGRLGTRGTVTAAVAAMVALAAVAAGGGPLLSTHPVPWRPLLAPRPVSLPSARPLPPTPRPVRRPPGAGRSGDGGSHLLQLPAWLARALVVVLVAIACILVLVVITRLLRRSLWRALAPKRVDAEPVHAPPGRSPRQVGAELDAAELALLDEAEPRAGVIGCWLRLERAAAEAGLHRTPGETSAELRRRVQTAFPVDEAAIERLNRLYLSARFAPDRVGEDQRDDARAALDDVRRGLHAGAGGP